MLSSSGQVEGCNPLDYGRQCLPQMTALFVDGLAGKKRSSPSVSLLAPHKRVGSNINRFKVPISSNDGITADEVKSFCARIEKPSCTSRKAQPGDDDVIMRQFICGISSCFNNILMGIWGNISLMSISLDKNNPVMNQVRNLDRLIHNGSLLIHSLFGYLAERRVATRHLRLVQLVQEINQRIQSSGVTIDIQEIEKSMELAFLKKRPGAVAGGMADVLDQLLHWMDTELKSALSEMPKDLVALKRLNTIDRLLTKGFYFTKQLRLYSGEKSPDWRKVNIKSLVREQAKQFRNRFKHLEIVVEVSDRLSPLKADGEQLQFVLEQLMANAAAAMPDGGKILISARPINEEAPKERCVVNPASNYTVITVSDRGVGMSKEVQSKIFLPFFVGKRESNPIGLGLAASSTIAKKHGGYLQVISSKRQGSTFKFYLPEARNDILPISL